MTFDIIVFTQDELNDAINNGIKSIGLCDNKFVLPILGGMNYTAIGTMTACIDVSLSEFNRLDIACCGFVPSFTSKKLPLMIPTSHTSFTSSYITSYITSYSMYYEYEYETSFFGSYTTSFRTSMSSFVTSFRQNAGECIMVNGYGINLI